jgi:hypothetical protein
MLCEGERNSVADGVCGTSVLAVVLTGLVVLVVDAAPVVAGLLTGPEEVVDDAERDEFEQDPRRRAGAPTAMRSSPDRLARAMRF